MPLTQAQGSQPDPSSQRLARPDVPIAGIERAESIGAQGKRTIPALDGVRGIAASLVFLVHFHAAFGFLLPAGRPTAFGLQLQRIGYNGVNVFFVLSGFLIYGSLIGRKTALRKFFVRRLRRIFPTYWVVLAAYLCVSLLWPPLSKLPSSGVPSYVLANVLLLPGVFPISPIITVAWSLSYEIFFYLGIAALVTLLALRRWPKSLRVSLILVMAAAWALIEPLRAVMGSFYMFLPGLLLYEIVSGDDEARVMPPVMSAIVLLVFATSIVMEPLLSNVAVSRGPAPASEWGSVTLAPLSLLALSIGIGALLISVIRFHSDVGRILGSGLVRHVGLVSYSFYLIHGLTINGVALLGNTLLRGYQPAPSAIIYFALMPVVYLICVGTATTLFRTVEKRFSF